MKVFKNLFGKGDKIHVNEIAYKDLQDIVRLLGWGVIVESGSNSNGSYIKFGEGTMICYRSDLTLNYHVDGDLNVKWTYPQPFSEVPTVLAVRRQAELYATKRIPSITVMTQSVDKASISLERHTDDVFVATDKGLINAFAIGRWK